MTNFNELNVTNSTIIEWEGKELKTTQDPYLDLYRSFVDAPDQDAYQAHAIDESENEYVIYWEILNNSEDESDRCDWVNPMQVIEL